MIHYIWPMSLLKHNIYIYIYVNDIMWCCYFMYLIWHEMKWCDVTWFDVECIDVICWNSASSINMDIQFIWGYIRILEVWTPKGNWPLNSGLSDLGLHRLCSWCLHRLCSWCLNRCHALRGRRFCTRGSSFWIVLRGNWWEYVAGSRDLASYGDR